MQTDSQYGELNLEGLGGIDPEDLKEIQQEIEDISRSSGLQVQSDFKAGSRRELLFPLLVNAIVLVIAGAVLGAVFVHFNREQRDTFLHGTPISSVEGQLLQQIRENASSELSSKEQEIQDVRNKLLALEAERGKALGGLTGDALEQAEEVYRKAQEDYQARLKTLNQERKGMQDDLRNKENEIRVQEEQQSGSRRDTAAAGQNNAEAEEYKAALQSMTAQRDAAVLRNSQIQAMYAQIQSNYSKKNWQEVVNGAAALQGYLKNRQNQGDAVGIDMFLVSTLERNAKLEQDKIAADAAAADAPAMVRASELNALQKQLEDEKTEAAELRRQLDNERKALAAATAAAAAAPAAAAAVPGMTAAEKAAYDNRIADYEQRLKASDGQSAAYQKQIADFEQRLKASDGQSAAYQKQIADLQNELDRQKKAAAAGMASMTASADYAALQEKYDAAEKSLADLRGRNASLETQLKDEQEKSRTTAEALASVTTSASSAADSGSAALARVQAEASALRQRVSTLESQINGNEAEIRRLNASIDSLSKDSATGQQSAAAQAASLRSRISELEDTNANITRARNELQRQYDALSRTEAAERGPAAAYQELIAAYETFDKSASGMPELKDFLGKGQPITSFPELNKKVIAIADDFRTTGHHEGVASATYLLEVALRIQDKETRRRYLAAMRQRYPGQQDILAFIDILDKHL